MKTMKTCKMGCGKMKAGGTVKKIKKMAKGGAADYNFGYPLNGLPMRPTNGNTDISKNQMGTNATMKKGGIAKMKKGGSTGDKKWIQKAINPAHKGYCTPETKKTCTPKRKALAKTLKKMAKNK